jgi:hypothetical protein
MLKVSAKKLKKYEKEYFALKEQQEDPIERLQVGNSSTYLVNASIFNLNMGLLMKAKVDLIKDYAYTIMIGSFKCCSISISFYQMVSSYYCWWCLKNALYA